MVQKLIVGLTGGFGVGKSSVAQLFKNLGADVIDADKIAHDAMKKAALSLIPSSSFLRKRFTPPGKKWTAKK